MLVCPVRNCRLPLTRHHRRLTCEHNHSFDIARSGYINLLQPQDRRSPHPGDTPSAVAARRRLHGLGLTRPLLDAIAELLAPTREDVILDAGCGDGFYLGALALQSGFDAHGIDISTHAIQAAARRYPTCEWIVANADRFIPYADHSFSAILSITARRNAPEFHRVLQNTGRLLIALPAPDDLVELRGPGRDRTTRAIESFSPTFTLATRRRVTTAASLDASAVHDLLLSIYRPLRPRPAGAMQVTFSLDLLLFQNA